MSTFGLVMIVKDGAADLARTLPTVAPHIATWTIVDTGSTDDTRAVIERELAGTPGILATSEWVDFGTNRSEALALARGSADWLLLMDADMALTIDPGWEPDPAVDAYMIEMGGHTAFSYRLPLLVRGDLAWHSVGAVHEYTALADGRDYVRQTTDAVRIDMGRDDRGSPEKYRWHLGMLLRSWRADRGNPRTAYYIGQTYASLGDARRARRWFLVRAGMAGFDEERYYAAYRAAQLAPDWPTRAAELLAAWESRPGRLEALHALVSELNRRDMHHAAYRLTSEPTPPSADVLFVSRDVWDWGMTFQRSIAAYWVGRLDECRDLCDLLLDIGTLPPYIRAQVIVNRGYTERRAA
jgi:glycosyltransferase involved in cell wall biosynthesis